MQRVRARVVLVLLCFVVGFVLVGFCLLGLSTPRFYREGSPQLNEICVSLQFWAIDTTFLPRRLTASK